MVTPSPAELNEYGAELYRKDDVHKQIVEALHATVKFFPPEICASKSAENTCPHLAPKKICFFCNHKLLPRGKKWALVFDKTFLE